MNIIFEYIKYRWNAKGRHGTHSPFVFDFTDKCLRSEINPTFKNERKHLFNLLSKDNSSITIEDFGAGSKYLSNERKISQLYKTSSSKGKYGDLLFQLSQYYSPKNCLEFGTSIGIGTIHLSKGFPESSIVTVEACKATREQALKNFDRMKCLNIESVQATFKSFLETYKGSKFDLIFIDGHHDGEALISYINELTPFSHGDTLFILDDIRWSDSMLKAWNDLIKNSDFHVTMDLFRMGIIAKRPQQEKEHFIVKI